MKGLTGNDLDAILQHALAMADIPITDFEIELEDVDLESLTTTVATPPNPGAVPATVLTGSAKITIRVPAWTLAAFRAESAKTKVPYQRLMNRTLQSAAMGFI